MKCTLCKKEITVDQDYVRIVGKDSSKPSEYDHLECFKIAILNLSKKEKEKK